jgi:hypothetical protein
MSEIVCSGWACQDCLMLLTNGTTPPELDEQEAEDRLNAIEITSGTYSITLGLPSEAHECGRQNGDEVDECECERVSFTWSACDVCGGNLGGSRDAVTFWTRDEPTTTHGKLPPGHSLTMCLEAELVAGMHG